MPNTPHTSGLHRSRKGVLVGLAGRLERDVDDRAGAAQPDRVAAELAEPVTRHLVAVAQREQALDVALLAGDDDVAAGLAEERDVVAPVQRRDVELGAR